MKRGIRSAILLAVLALLPALAAADSSAPDFQLRDLEGRQVTLSSFEGKVPVLLAFGATWCPYCTRQVPKLNQLKADLGSDEVVILGVDSGEPRARVEEHVRKLGIRYPMLLDSDSKVAKRYGVDSIPFLVLIDRNGNIVRGEYGVSERLIKTIQALD